MTRWMMPCRNLPQRMHPAEDAGLPWALVLATRRSLKPDPGYNTTQPSWKHKSTHTPHPAAPALFSPAATSVTTSHGTSWAQATLNTALSGSAHLALPDSVGLELRPSIPQVTRPHPQPKSLNNSTTPLSSHIRVGTWLARTAPAATTQPAAAVGAALLGCADWAAKCRALRKSLDCSVLVCFTDSGLDCSGQSACLRCLIHHSSSAVLPTTQMIP